MIDMARIKAATTKARAVFFCSTISFQRLCLGVNFSITTKVISKIRIPSAEKASELRSKEGSNKVNNMIYLILFVITWAIIVPGVRVSSK
jgi:hypothetical protein